MSDDEAYQLTPFGLLSMSVGDTAARNLLKEIGRYMKITTKKGHFRAIILEDDGELHFRDVQGKAK